MKLSTYTLLISATQAVRMEVVPETEEIIEEEALKCQFVFVDENVGALCSLIEAAVEGEEDMCAKLKSKEE